MFRLFRLEHTRGVPWAKQVLNTAQSVRTPVEMNTTHNLIKLTNVCEINLLLFTAYALQVVPYLTLTSTFLRADI